MDGPIWIKNFQKLHSSARATKFLLGPRKKSSEASFSWEIWDNSRRSQLPKLSIVKIFFGITNVYFVKSVYEKNCKSYVKKLGEQDGLTTTISDFRFLLFIQEMCA